MNGGMLEQVESSGWREQMDYCHKHSQQVGHYILISIFHLPWQSQILQTCALKNHSVNKRSILHHNNTEPRMAAVTVQMIKKLKFETFLRNVLHILMID